MGRHFTCLKLHRGRIFIDCDSFLIRKSVFCDSQNKLIYRYCVCVCVFKNNKFNAFCGDSCGDIAEKIPNPR